MKVFIYGTLKRGFPLFDKGLRGARYIGDVETFERCPMYIAGSLYGPMMLDRPGEGMPVRGELFDVDEDRLHVLDELEAVGDEGSFRSMVDVTPVGGGVTAPAVAFMKFEDWLDPLRSGYLDDYQDRRFVPPWER